jgi:hypothetical protein
MGSGHQPLPLPAAILNVAAQGMAGTAEFSYRLDKGPWHAFQRADAAGHLTVADPAFLLQGRHQIDIESRMAESPRGVSAPVPVGFDVQWDGPSVRIRVDALQRSVRVAAHDLMTPDGALKYAYRVGPDGSWSSFGPAREIDFAAVNQAGALGVRVVDAAGLVTEAAWALPGSTQPPATAAPLPQVKPASTGCSAMAGEHSWAGLLLAALCAFRRRAPRAGRSKDP